MASERDLAAQLLRRADTDAAGARAMLPIDEVADVLVCFHAQQAGDAGGHEIVSTYYVDNQTASEEQNKQLADYTYDPLGRTLETTSENKETKAKSTKVSHYAGAGGALTWTSEGSEKWARNVPGIDGTLCATQEAGKAPVLQLHDLGGNIVGVVEDNETVTKLGSTYNSTEFGVPNEGKTPPKYAWLGASGVSTETSFGSGVATQGGASYVPQIARALQTAPVVPPGAFPNGSPGTQFTAAPVTAGAIAGAQEIATQFWQSAEAERQKAREKEAAEALQKCQEEGGCVTIEDPPWVHHYNQQEAEGLLDELKVIHGGLEIAGILGLVDDLTKPVIEVAEGFIQDNFTVDAIEEWAKNLENQVEGCLTDIVFWVSIEEGPTCRVSIPSIKIYFVIATVDLPEYWHDGTVSWCVDGWTYCVVE